MRFDALRKSCLELAIPERLRVWRLLAETDAEWLAQQEAYRLPEPRQLEAPSFLHQLRRASTWSPPPASEIPLRFESSLARAMRHTSAPRFERDAGSGQDEYAHSETVVYDLELASASSDSDSASASAKAPTTGDDLLSATAGADTALSLEDAATGDDCDAVMDAADDLMTCSQPETLADAPPAAGDASSSRGATLAAPKQVGKVHAPRPAGAAPARARRPPLKFTAKHPNDPRLLRENLATGDVEPVPSKVTQLTVSRFFAPRMPTASATRRKVSARREKRISPQSSIQVSGVPTQDPLPLWTRIKTDLGTHEVITPANGSCYYFAIGAAKINVCPDQFTCRDRKMRREGGYYRREINLAILARLPDLLTTGTYDTEQLYRRFLRDGQSRTELLDHMERHFREAALVSCDEPCSVRYWAHEEEILGTAFWFGEPIFVFEVCPDDRVILQVFHGDNDKRGARGEYWPVERGIGTIRELLKARVLPLLLVYYPGSSAEHPSGHFNVLRLPLQRYLEWAGTAGRRTRMAKRRATCLSRLGMLPSPSDVPSSTQPCASPTNDSDFQPSQDVQTTEGSSATATAVSSEQTPAGPASPVTPTTPVLSQDVPMLLQRLQTRKPVPESLETSFKKVRHANKISYLRWRDAIGRTDKSVAADLRVVATPEAALVVLQTRPTVALRLLQALPHGIVALAQLDDQVITILGRALICDVRLFALQAYAQSNDTPRRRSTAVSAWLTASGALSRLDARWSMLHDESRWRRLLPASIRATRSPAGLPDDDLGRLLLVLTAVLPDVHPAFAARAPTEQAAMLLRWMSMPVRAAMVETTATSLAARDWLQVYNLRGNLQLDSIDLDAAAPFTAGAPSPRC